MADTDKKNTVEKSSTDNIKRANAFLDLLDRVRSIRWKGILDAIFKIFFLTICVIGLKIVVNPRPTIEYFMSMQEKIQTEQHQELINKRVANTPLINNELQLMQAALGTDRTFIIEFHNGNNNMAALPFWWGDMTYEYVHEDVYGVRDNWLNISLTRFTFLTNLVSNNCWYGHVDDIMSIDEGFSKKLKADDVEYVAFILLYNTDGKPLGVLGAANLEGHSHDVDSVTIHRNLVKFAQIINPLLIGK